MVDRFKPPEIFKLPHSLPLLASSDVKDTQIGGSFGTVSVVSYDYLTLLVTAKHVLLDTIDDFERKGKFKPSLYLPILPEWRCQNILSYTWRFISTRDDTDAYGKYDLAYAILSPEQTDEIDIDRVRVIQDSASYVGNNVCGVVQGYPSNSNRNVQIRLRGHATPTAVGYNSVVDTYPFRAPVVPDILTFRYDQKTVVWNGKKFLEVHEKRPSMSGLSGSPLFCCHVDNIAVTNPIPVIGFFIEQNGTLARATSSRVLVEHITRHHRDKLAMAQPHSDFQM